MYDYSRICTAGLLGATSVSACGSTEACAATTAAGSAADPSVSQTTNAGPRKVFLNLGGNIGYTEDYFLALYPGMFCLNWPTICVLDVFIQYVHKGE